VRPLGRRAAGASVAAALTAPYLLLSPACAVSAAAATAAGSSAADTMMDATAGRDRIIPAPVDPMDAAPLPKVFGRDGLMQRLRTTRRVGVDDDLAKAYARRPADLTGVQLPPFVSGARDVAIIFHGSGGPDRETAATEAALAAADAAAGFQRAVVNFDWRKWFTPDTDRLSFTSQALGRQLGTQLFAAAPLLRSLHVIGTSAGSFAADACATAYIDAASARLLPPSNLAREGLPRAAVRLTLADPFSALEGASVNGGRGAQFFGRSADFAEHYLNTDDIVPNTGVPLPYCYCYDVTGAAERRSFPPPDKSGQPVRDLILRSLGYHNWPLGYFARHYQTEVDARGRLVLPSHVSLPRGALVKVA